MRYTKTGSMTVTRVSNATDSAFGRRGGSMTGAAKLETGRRQLRFSEALRLASLYGVHMTSFEPAAPRLITG